MVRVPKTASNNVSRSFKSRSKPLSPPTIKRNSKNVWPSCRVEWDSSKSVVALKWKLVRLRIVSLMPYVPQRQLYLRALL
jgi:hypothetical protein